MPSGFYRKLREKRNDDSELSACIERVVNQLESHSTTGDMPGMLLGKIQSGKTRCFVGVIAEAFDRDFDIALVLTKGTKTLSEQTVSRLSEDFRDFIDDDDFLLLDIMKLPGKLTKSELRRKIIVVAKKQANNLARLVELIKENQQLQNRRVLLIDDEADLASVRFLKKRGEENISQGTIAERIDELRRMVEEIAFLQVTATPYSLYLQPERYDPATEGENFVFKPKRPAFTELLPIHGGYVGGDDFFDDYSDSDARAYLVVEVSNDEQDALRRPDQRRVHPDRVLESPNTSKLRKSIVTFILAACIRRWQQQVASDKLKKYSMIIHNDTQKAAHAWQDLVITWIFDAMSSSAENDPSVLRPMFDDAFDDLKLSISADRGRIPEKEDAFEMFIKSLQDDDVVREKVNSDQDVMNLLDGKAELRLRTPFNIFVGGNILDRGITIPNLISFYYGRNPKTMQADTVLQHSRMYGNRDRRDLAVTRFYTSEAVHDRLRKINIFENALRNAFERADHDKGVVFIQTDSEKRVRPCAPNKVLLSDIVAVEPSSLLLPTGFKVRSGKAADTTLRKANHLIEEPWRDSGNFVSIDARKALDIIDAIRASLEFDTVKFEWDAMSGLIDYYSDTFSGGDGRIFLLAETGRRLSRAGSGDKSGRSILGTALREKILSTARAKPALILLQQEGSRDLGWSGQKFWWPILAAPATAEPCVFATKTAA